MELAQGGTLFLDEIGDLPLNLQPKLLRAIQHRSINRIGGKKEISLDIRIICATNRNLIDEIENGTFRRDLYHRIATGYINIPPLRKRKEEIEPLARLFLNEITQEKKKRKLGISQEAIELLQKYHWPGNVRELKSAIERVIITSDDLTILAKHFDFLTSINYAKTKENVQLKIEIGKMDLGKIEKKILLSTLDYFNYNKSLTAKSLGLSRATLYRKMRKNSF
jgi:two-component system response regulator AtoC